MNIVIIHKNVFWLSIRTRIKTMFHAATWLRHNTYFDYPLEQGLRQLKHLQSRHHRCVFWLSIRTRIKTWEIINAIIPTKYFDYPLEQGLRHGQNLFTVHCFKVFWLSIRTRIKTKQYAYSAYSFVYFDYPLEQGLRHWNQELLQRQDGILIIH